MDELNKKFYHCLNFFFSAVLVLSIIFPQIAKATIFQPGETLEPDCAPGSPNCGVAIFSLNGQTNTTQTLVTGSTGTDFSISSLLNTHTFNIPSSSSLNRGLLTSGDWSLFNGKQPALGFTPLNPVNNLSDVLSTVTALNNLLPSQTGNSGKVLQTNGTNPSWIAAGGIGTVTSVALALPSIFSVAGSPVTASGTLSGAFVSQSPNLVFASPNGISGTPAFRSIVVTDLPTGIPNANLANSSISFVTGTTGTDLNISGTPVSLGGTLTINIPSASAVNRGLLTPSDWSTFNAKQPALGFTPLNPANNLSDLASASVARTSLGLGTLATQSGTFSGTSSGTNSGDQTTISGNAGTATALQTARTINGVSFDGTGNIIVTAAAGTLTGTTLAGGVTTSSLTSIGTLTDLTVTNPINGSITGSSSSATGNASTATALQTARTINGASFNGTANITVAAAAGTLTGTTLAGGVTASSLTSIGTLTDLTVTNPINGNITGSSSLATGNAATATALETARTINGVSFNGTSNITVVAAAGTLTGTALAANVVNSSLTSVGTLSSLLLSGAVTGATGYNGLVVTANTGVITTGTWNGTTVAVLNGGTGTTNGSITGTGALSFTSNTTNALTLDSGTTGDINIGTNANAKTLNFGTGAAVAENINIGGTGANVIAIGNTQTGGSVNIGAGMTTGTISIGGTGAQTGTITIDGGTGTQAINIGTGAGNKTVTLGSTTGTATTTIQSGTGNINFQVASAGTTGNVQVGAGAGGSATPDLFVLDVKNTTGDPTGTNGATYYNSNTNKFRCFQNGAWTDCINGDKYFLSKSTDQSVTSSTTLTSDTALTFAVGSGETWVFNFSLFVTNGASAGPDFKAAILGAAGWTCSAQMSGSEANGAAFPQAVSTNCTNTPTAMVNGAIAADGGNGFFVRIVGVITTTSAGSVTLQFAQNTSSASAVTVKGGSSATAFKVGGADFAEVYYGSESLPPGTVVSIDPGRSAGVMKSTSTNDKNLLGIVTTNPGMVIGENNSPSNGVPVLVALSGRVPVKVNTENGAILPGDYLTSSSTPGVAMKSGGTGEVIGQAMSQYDGTDTGTVTAFVKNFVLGGNSTAQENISPRIDTSGIEFNFSSFLSSIQSEIAHDPIAVIAKAATDSKKLFTDFIAARVTAIRGYFDEVFAKKVHTEQLCLKKSDGSEVCVGGDQLNSLLQNANITPPAAIESNLPPSSDAKAGTLPETTTNAPSTSPEAATPVVTEPTPISGEAPVTPPASAPQ